MALQNSPGPSFPEPVKYATGLIGLTSRFSSSSPSKVPNISFWIKILLSEYFEYWAFFSKAGKLLTKLALCMKTGNWDSKPRLLSPDFALMCVFSHWLPGSPAPPLTRSPAQLLLIPRRRLVYLQTAGYGARPYSLGGA